jgi:hypothetical protein
MRGRAQGVRAVAREHEHGLLRLSRGAQARAAPRRTPAERGDGRAVERASSHPQKARESRM